VKKIVPDGVQVVRARRPEHAVALGAVLMGLSHSASAAAARPAPAAVAPRTGSSFGAVPAAHQGVRQSAGSLDSSADGVEPPQKGVLGQQPSQLQSQSHQQYQHQQRQQQQAAYAHAAATLPVPAATAGHRVAQPNALQRSLSFNMSAQLTHIGANRRAPQTVTALVLGKTGAGKSTFLNCLANVFAQQWSLKLQDDDEYPFKVLVPTALYPQPNVAGAAGNESSEWFAPGQACTQKSNVYRFKCGLREFVFVDTPGLSDPRGPEQDEKNLEDILQVGHRRCRHLTHRVSLLTAPVAASSPAGGGEGDQSERAHHGGGRQRCERHAGRGERDHALPRIHSGRAPGEPGDDFYQNQSR